MNVIQRIDWVRLVVSATLAWVVVAVVAQGLVLADLVDPRAWQTRLVAIAAVGLLAVVVQVLSTADGPASAQGLRQWLIPVSALRYVYLALAAAGAALLLLRPWDVRADLGVLLVALAGVGASVSRPVVESGGVHVVPARQEPTDRDAFAYRAFAWSAQQPRAGSPNPEPRQEVGDDVGVWVSRDRLAEARSRNRLFAYSSINRAKLEEWVEEGGCPEVEQVAKRLQATCMRRGLDKREAVGLALNLVQKIPYRSDKASTGHDEYWRYPIETLFDNEGDCEDTSILLVALLSAMGERAAFIGSNLDHVLVGVADLEGVAGTSDATVLRADRDYVLCETTSEGWQIGVDPNNGDANLEVLAAIEPLEVRRRLRLRGRSAERFGHESRVLLYTSIGLGLAVAAGVTAALAL